LKRAAAPQAQSARLDACGDPLGLTNAEAGRRLRAVGANTLVPAGRKTSAFILLGRLIADPMVLLLLAAGVTYLALGDRFDAAVTLGALVPIFLVNAVLEVRAERALDALRRLASPAARVVREGWETIVPASEVVPGDVMLVQEGDIFVADGELVFGSNLSCDESALTGESQPALKHAAGSGDERKILAGTTLLSGRGTVVVTATGARSEYGRIGKLLTEMETVQTPLERAIHRLVYQIGIAVSIACVAIVFLERWHGEGWAAAAIAGVSLAMAAIPEELPMVYTLYLALGAWRLSKDDALVRRLSSVETLGATSVICVDKTGTLTFGRLELVDTFTVEGVSERDLIEGAVLASEPDPFDTLDKAVLAHARVLGIDVEGLHRRDLVRDYPFDAQA
jgi:Ca2+-transporting ATPase